MDARFRIELDVVIRRCRREDLRALEWFGAFEAHRPLIRAVFDQHRRGEAIMLVAEVNGEPSGQAWIDLVRRRRAGAAQIWAVRVLPCLQGCGIGTRLVGTAESLAGRAGFHTAELAVETDNPQARAFYERLGYRLTGTTLATHRAGAPPRQSTQWLLAKELRAPGRAGARNGTGSGRTAAHRRALDPG